MSSHITHTDSKDNDKHYPTPTRPKMQGAIEFCDRMGFPYYKEYVFRTFGVRHRQGYELIRKGSQSPNPSPRTRNHDPDRKKTRRCNHIISSKKIRKMELVLKEGIEARSLTWAQLGYKIDLDCSAK